MPKMFVTASFQNGENNEEVEHLCSMVRKAGFTDYCFARDEKVFSDPQEMMRRAKEEIEKSDYLLIDMTEKPVGRIAEAGMAYALGKQVVVIIKNGAELKETIKGISSLVIEYDNIDEIVEPLSRLI